MLMSSMSTMFNVLVWHVDIKYTVYMCKCLNGQQRAALVSQVS